MVANTWNTPLTIALDYAGAPRDLSTHAFIPHTNGTELDYEPLTGPLPPGEVAVLFLAQSHPEVVPYSFVECPRPALLDTDPLPDGTGVGQAFHIATDRPATVYSVSPYGGAPSFIPSATVLVPEGALDKDYLAVDAWDIHAGGILGKPAVQIVAPFDNTHVSVRLKETVDLPPAWDAGAGSLKTFTLAKGQLLQFMENIDFTGSAIVSDQPIAVFGGVSCFTLGGVLACDGAQQQSLRSKPGERSTPPFAITIARRSTPARSPGEGPVADRRRRRRHGPHLRPATAVRSAGEARTRRGGDLHDGPGLRREEPGRGSSDLRRWLHDRR